MIETFIWMVIGTVVGGLGCRARGQSAEQIAWTVPMALLGVLAGPPGLTLMTLWTFLGLTAAWWAGWFVSRYDTLGIGLVSEDRETEIFRHSVHGVMWVLPAIVFWCFLGNWWALFLLIPGALRGVLCEAGRQLSEGKQTATGSEWGEMFFGAAVGLTVALIA